MDIVRDVMKDAVRDAMGDAVRRVERSMNYAVRRGDVGVGLVGYMWRRCTLGVIWVLQVECSVLASMSV